MKRILTLIFGLLMAQWALADTWIDGMYYYLDATTKTASVRASSSSVSGHLIIPENITYAGEDYSVTSIGESAFSGRTGLTSVEIPNSVTSIGNYAFSRCTSLPSVDIPNSVTSIGYHAFYECSSLTSVVIPNSVTSIGEGAFSCSGLTSVVIGNSVTSIGRFVFEGCKSLTSVIIPNSVTSIGDWAFSECTGLTSINIPNSVRSIGYNVFLECTGIKTLKFEDGETELSLGYCYKGDNRKGLFGDCPLATLYLGRTLSYAAGSWNGYSPFYNKGTLKELTIGNSVTSIGEYAFSGCNSLTSFEIPNSVTSIGDWAFSECTGLTSINIPNSVTSIGYSAFGMCDKLKKVIISDLKSWCEIDFADSSSNPLYYAGHLYMGENEIKDLVIPTSVSSIGARAFYMCSGLNSIVIPNSVITIGENAFYNCSGLISVVIGNSLTSIGRNAFASCPIEKLTVNTNADLSGGFSYENLTDVIFGDEVTTISGLSGATKLANVTLPSGLKTISDNTFSNCTSLVSIQLPEGLETIGNNAFYNAGLTELTLPQSLTSIGRNAFASCPIEKLGVNTNIDLSGVFSYENLTDVIFGDEVTTISGLSGATKLANVTLPSGLKTISDNTFSNCTSLVSIQLPEGLETIGNSAFYKTGIVELTLPPSLTSIGQSAFASCPIEKLNINTDANITGAVTVANLTEVVFGENLTTISGLSGATKLAKVTFPSKLKKISDNTFRKCTSLTSIDLPEGLETIGEGAFDYCGSLTNIKFPSTLVAIGATAFAECYNVSEIELPDQIKTIGNYAFGGCGIQNLTLPKSLTSVGELAFVLCPLEKIIINTGADLTNVFYYPELFPWSNLQEVIFGDDAVTIPVFEGATQLTDVTLPSVLEVIPDNAFRGCTSLEVLEVPVSLTTIGANAFYGCESLEKINLHKNVKEIGQYAFYNCPQLRSINVPNGVESLQPFTFYGCSSLTEVNLPGTVTLIGEKAFQGCTALINVSLGTGTYDIKDYVFDGCTNIKNIYSLAKNPPYAEQYTFPIAAYNNAYLYVREESLGKYNLQNPWYRFDNMKTVNDGISLSHYEVTMAGNQVFQLGVYGSDNKVKWTTSNPEIAYANECGLIVAMGPTGTTTITATVDGVSVSCRVIVNTPRLLAKAKAPEDEEIIEPNDIIVESIGGEPLMVNVRLIPVGSRTVLDWSSSDDAVASVQDGLVTVTGPGDVEFSTGTENGLEDSYEVSTEDMELPDTTGVDASEWTSNPTMPNDIFTLTGVCLKRNATQEDIDALSPGIYIIGGKKVVKN